MTLDLICPCGHPRPYSACCQPLHRGERSALTAEELMRSRYAAFSQGEVDYLIQTLHPDQREALNRRELEASVKELRWVGLTILDVLDGEPTQETGIVEFEARYATPALTCVLHERSRFVRESGRWFYVDGTGSEREQRAAATPGRNEPCSCGSGVKYKRCCGGPKRPASVPMP